MKAPNWPAAKVAMWPLADIKPYPNNPRTHPAAQIEQLARAMREDGVTMPILVDEKGVIIAGHGRKLAALANKFKEYPVVIARGWSEERKRASRLRDNQMGLLSGWDNKLITAEIGQLKLAGYNLQLLGFPEAQLRQWEGGTLALKDPDETPPPPKTPTVKLGEVWALGDHRVMCGDATDTEHWHRLLGPERASLVFTDPPYGVSYQGDKFEIIQGDKKRRDDLYKMLVRSFREMIRYANDKAAFYIWHSSSTSDDFAAAMKATGLTERQRLMWVKPAAVLSGADYQQQHEPCFYAAKEAQSPAFYGQRAESTVWNACMVRT